jgi:hypothetical protein
MTERGYWRHTGSGQIWAVEIEDERPVKCAGPLTSSDADQMILPYLDYSTTDVAPLQADWRSYVRHARDAAAQ